MTSDKTTNILVNIVGVGQHSKCIFLVLVFVFNVWAGIRCETWHEMSALAHSFNSSPPVYANSQTLNEILLLFAVGGANQA